MLYVGTFKSSVSVFTEAELLNYKKEKEIEGFGILVNILASAAGLNYLNGTNTVTYFGGVLFDKINSVV